MSALGKDAAAFAHEAEAEKDRLRAKVAALDLDIAFITDPNVDNEIAQAKAAYIAGELDHERLPPELLERARRGRSG